jgi:hypothetical protein
MGSPGPTFGTWGSPIYPGIQLPCPILSAFFCGKGGRPQHPGSTDVDRRFRREQGASQAAEKLVELVSNALFCNRARLQSCRKSLKINAGFSPCGMFFALLAWKQAFFRSLFSPLKNGPTIVAFRPGSRRSEASTVAVLGKVRNDVVKDPFPASRNLPPHPVSNPVET